MSRVGIYIVFLFLYGTLLSSCKSKNSNVDSTELNISELIQPNTTTLICVRHAEKEADKSDPFLTNAGKQRAKDFVRLLDNVKVDAIYSSEYNRTLETVMPLSQNRQIATKLYDPRNLPELKKNLLSKYKNQTVVVVGHSNSTPQFANLLLGNETYLQFDEADYDNLILLSVDNNGNVQSQLLQFGTEAIVE